MMSSHVVAPGGKLALSGFGRIRSQNGASARHLSVASKSPVVVKPGGNKSNKVLDAAHFRCLASTTTVVAGGHRRPDSPISNVRRNTRLAAMTTGDAAPKPTFDDENGGYTKSFLVVRLTVFLR